MAALETTLAGTLHCHNNSQSELSDAVRRQKDWGVVDIIVRGEAAVCLHCLLPSSLGSPPRGWGRAELSYKLNDKTPSAEGVMFALLSPGVGFICSDGSETKEGGEAEGEREREGVWGENSAVIVTTKLATD